MEKKGCVLIHGFTGSPREIEVIANHLKKFDIKVSTPTLPGHGYPLNKKDMNRFGWKDWVEAAESALLEMIEQVEEVYLVGFSMGGIIAAYLSTKYSIKKLVLLSASVYYLSMKRFLKDFFEGLRHQTISDHFQHYFYKISHTPLKSAINFRRLVKTLIPYIQQVKVPTLIIQGELDDLVDPKSAVYIFKTISSQEKYLYFLSKSKHIIGLDVEKEKVVQLVQDFFFPKEGGIKQNENNL